MGHRLRVAVGPCRALDEHDVAVPFFIVRCFMDWNEFYGAYISYHHKGIHSYNEVIVNDWHQVMSELDSFLKNSTKCFIDSFCDLISWQNEMDDTISEYKYLKTSMSSCEVIEQVIENEIKNAVYKKGSPYTSRHYWHFAQSAFEDVWNTDDSYFKILFEGPLPQFIPKWHGYLMESCCVYPQILRDNSKTQLGPKVYPEDYELLGKLSLFLNVDEQKFPEALNGFFYLIDDYNKKHC